MPVTLPLEIYETFELQFGKGDARKLVKCFETAISDITEYKWAVTKEELFSKLASKEEISKLATKEEISKLATKEEINKLATKEEMVKLSGRMDALELKIENKLLHFDRKFTIMFVVLFFTTIFLNQNSLTFLLQVLGLIK